MLKLCTKLPPATYTPATDNLAASMTFLRSWYQSVGAYTFTEHYQALYGSRAKSVDMVINTGIVDLTVDFSHRDITKPSTTTPLAGTPVYKAFSDITVVGWTHIDNGSLPLSINSITYPCDNFHVNLNNHLNEKVYNGSDLIDTNKCMKQTITGDCMVVVGKDLNLEGFFESVALSNIPLVYTVKSGSFVWTLTDVNMKVLGKTQAASNDDEWKLNLSFDAKAQAITP